MTSREHQMALKIETWSANPHQHLHSPALAPGAHLPWRVVPGSVRHTVPDGLGQGGASVGGSKWQTSGL